jgi:hypothetical protein
VSVIRDGKPTQVSVYDVVVGDIVSLSQVRISSSWIQFGSCLTTILLCFGLLEKLYTRCDVVMQGDNVCADGLVVQSSDLKVNESALTGACFGRECRLSLMPCFLFREE